MKCVNVWWWKQGDDAIAWEDVASSDRAILKKGDILEIVNQDDELFMVRIVELEPARVAGIIVEEVTKENVK